MQIQRLASYERYFQDLLCETNADHPDLDEVHKARDKAQEVSIRRPFFWNIEKKFLSHHLHLAES